MNEILTKITLAKTSFTKATTVVAMLLAVISGKALALDPTYTALFSSDAIKGYDAVAYFTENAAIKGESEFSTEYQQATWLFSSQNNLDLFKSAPEKYAPQYGGYCAYAVSQGSTASIKPELFTIHDGKLYLNYNESVNKKWTQNKDAFIRDADQNWPELLAE
jgi:YHS domain-containing protein